jgi:cytidylate kinase
MIITIDGPIATGKSTIAKQLAHELGFIFFDTGAMYRCVAYGVAKNHVDIHDPKALEDYLKTFVYEIKRVRGDRIYLVNGEDVTLKIRSPEVTAQVSEVAALPVVRERLVHIQRQFAQGINSVFEGRDMGTTVFPEPDVIKIFLTGRSEVRAKRRFDELRTKFPEETAKLTLQEAERDINQRDEYDSTRDLSPLRQADDAYVIDTSDYSVEDIVMKILEYLDMRRAKKMPPPIP